MGYVLFCDDGSITHNIPFWTHREYGMGVRFLIIVVLECSFYLGKLNLKT